MLCLVFSFFFFFQAEDGIRDVAVTGVQTCALPISSGSDIAVRLTPPKQLTLEQCLEWIEDDELVEVTPASIRIRKTVLDHSQREVMAKKAKKAAAEG